MVSFLRHSTQAEHACIYSSHRDQRLQEQNSLRTDAQLFTLVQNGPVDKQLCTVATCGSLLCSTVLLMFRLNFLQTGSFKVPLLIFKIILILCVVKRVYVWGQFSPITLACLP